MFSYSVKPNSLLKTVGDEFLTSINHYDEFHVNILLDRSIYRPMWTHMGNGLANHLNSKVQHYFVLCNFERYNNICIFAPILKG